jgi:hypothetical protein
VARVSGLATPYSTPVPVRLTERSPPPPPFTFRDATFAPFVVGLNATLITHFALAASGVPQPFVNRNWLAFVPPSATVDLSVALLKRPGSCASMNSSIPSRVTVAPSWKSRTKGAVARRIGSRE